jgi:hypothetical protein
MKLSDPYLKTLNATLNTGDLSFGITLVVNGSVITGDMISAKSFFKGFADTFADAWPGGPNESIREGFGAWSEAPNDSGLVEDFIHLKNARYVNGKEMVPSTGTGMLWRGSLDSVSGFSLGSFNIN